MDNNQRKDLFSRAFVKAIAAQLGYRSSIPDVDDDSVDLILQARGFPSGIRNPQIEVQLKCTEINTGDSGFLKFVLSKKNYVDLRGGDLLCPRYLFVLIVPDEIDEWLVHVDDKTIMKHCCYWFSLAALPETTNRKNVTISIPRSNLLTAESLAGLMWQASLRGAA